MKYQLGTLQSPDTGGFHEVHRGFGTKGLFLYIQLHILVFLPTDVEVLHKAPIGLVKTYLYRGFIQPKPMGIEI